MTSPIKPSIPSYPQRRRADSYQNPLSAIAIKLVEIGQINAVEKKILENIAHQPIIGARLFGYFGQAGRIHSLAAGILSNNRSLKEAREILLSDPSTPSTIETQAFAELILAYDEASHHSYFKEEVDKLSAKGLSLDEKRVGELVRKHNAISLPVPERAGLLALQVDGHKVYYDQKGELFLAGANQKQTVPLTLPKAHLGLSTARIEQMREVYRKFAEGKPYSNFGPTLAFMRYYREYKEVNPQLTIKEAFESFQSDPSTLYDEYGGSGNCVVLTSKLEDELRKKGFEPAAIGQYTRPRTSYPPLFSYFPGDSPAWEELDRATEDVHHCGLIAHYTDRAGNERGIFFNFFSPFPEQLEEAPWNEMEETIMGGARDTKGRITNVGHIVKAQASGRTKMACQAGDGVLGIDLMEDTIYLNPAGMKGLQGLPLNENGKLSLNLRNLTLQHDARDTYWIEGNPVEMTHREALNRLVEITRERFHLSHDFEENIITLAENTDALFDGVFLAPSKTAKVVYKEIMEANKAFQDMRQASNKLSELYELPLLSSAALIEEYDIKLETVTTTFNALKQALLQDNPNEIRRLANLIAEQKKEMDTLQSKIMFEMFEPVG